MIHVKVGRSLYTYYLFALLLALSACDTANQTDSGDNSDTMQLDTGTGGREDNSEDAHAGETPTEEVLAGTSRATSSVFDTQDCSQCNLDSFSEGILDEIWAECCPMTSCKDGECRLVCKEESDFGF